MCSLATAWPTKIFTHYLSTFPPCGQHVAYSWRKKTTVFTIFSSPAYFQGLPALFLEHMQCFCLATHWARKTILIKELQRCLVELQVWTDSFMYTQMRVWITKVSSFNLNTRTWVKLHANSCNYKISKFYMQLIARTVHSLSTHRPRTVHEYYTQTTRILRACRCCNPFDRYCK